jgi:hypothetical protein
MERTDHVVSSTFQSKMSSKAINEIGGETLHSIVNKFNFELAGVACKTGKKGFFLYV